ncbi:copper homeostasis protein CutC [Microlunatus sp. Gsoil 973]|uniref:copper homeostasis protein CutC n=1 Tax=Microlunatus sp. Gsoil 973 TaxID=2672569 RepID=UPI0012B4908D|nr:copper homeostasis protein CutC [Microlunatus sp. Gsoil 973]QGN33670.1 copper homeostasis protein CutC [Microlunatus sp. Gsoil 973]
MAGLLEVIALHPADAERAEDGGADRLEVVGTMDHDGLSPEPALIGQLSRVTSLPLRVMVRLRDGFSTDGGELVRLKGLAAGYLDVGAEGLVLGFLNGLTEVDVEVVTELIDELDCPWTFHRAVDSCISPDRAWRDLRGLPRLDQVLTAGSARGVEDGLEDLLRRARQDDFARRTIMAGGGLKAEHVPWLANAGVRAFHIGSSARPTGSFKAYVDSELVRSWRTLIDDAVQRANGHRQAPDLSGA